MFIFLNTGIADANQLTYNLKTTIAITNKSPDTVYNIETTVPLIRQQMSSQYIETEIFNIEPKSIKEFANGERTAIINVSCLKPYQTENIKIEQQLKYYDSYINDDIMIDKYLRPSDKIESDHPDIISKAKSITQGCETNTEKAMKISEFTKTHITYNVNSPTRNRGAITALYSKTGVCEDYSTLFVAMCRAEGIPARVVNGFANSQYKKADWSTMDSDLSLSGYRHSWAQFYTESNEWVDVDILFGEVAPRTHIAQNYKDEAVKIRYKKANAANLEIKWTNQLKTNQLS